MDTREIKFTLPADIAREAEVLGLLEPGAIGELIRDALRRRRVDTLFQAADRLAGVGVPPLTEAELEGEILAARNARRNAHAGGR